MAPRTIIRPQVMEGLAKATGMTHYVGDLAETFKVSEHKIRDCMNNIIKDGAMLGLECTIPSRAWVYRPIATGQQKSSAKRVFEELAETKSGDLIIQDQDGKIYRAKELE